MDIQTLEGYTLRAWAALQEEHYDGWLLRFANGYTSRANSVNPLYGSTLDLDMKINYCEAEYRSRGLLPRFKLTPMSYPADLDVVLEQRGYVRQSESQVMTLDLARLPQVEKKPDGQFKVETELSETWLDAFMRLSETRATLRDTVRALLQRIEPQTYFASVSRDDQMIALTLGVHERHMIGLFDVVTQADQRGQGIGTALVSHVLASGGANTGYLQVMAGNAKAIRLYTRLGFQFVYPYWYRVKVDPQK